MPPPPPPNASDKPRYDDAFWTALERYRAGLERAIRALIPDRLRAKFGASDVVQNGFVKAFVLSESFDPKDREAPLRWLTRIVYFELRDAIRRFSKTDERDVARETPRDGLGSDASPPSPWRSAASEAEAREAEALVRRALDELPADQRAAIQLGELAGWTDAQAGDVLGKSADAVRKLRDRAFDTLAKTLVRAAEAHAGPDAEAPATALAAGGRVAGYVLRRPLGEGSMGRVFAARRADGTGPEVAVKLLHPRVARSPDLVARFRDEATISARIDGPGVVRVLEVIGGDGPDAPVAIVLELVEGRTLRKVGDADRPIPPARWLRIARSAAAAVATLHAHGVVHRDLKPENLLVRADDSVVVTDLGLARALDAANRRTASGTFVGTRWYAAPEQFRGPRNAVGPASDVYVLALTLHELWTGRHPFGDGADAVDRSITGRPPAASKARPGLPRGADELLARCLDPERANRPRDGRALAEALEAVGGAA
ncbi:MAG: sigma-70 family RNA polymerase sigma factor [Planctomycetes bacterium]|nr:sigma-70 family RNA polymerase sigma factor [Planctomycetota bacterium]